MLDLGNPESKLRCLLGQLCVQALVLPDGPVGQYGAQHPACRAPVGLGQVVPDTQPCDEAEEPRRQLHVPAPQLRCHVFEGTVGCGLGRVDRRQRVRERRTAAGWGAREGELFAAGQFQLVDTEGQICFLQRPEPGDDDDHGVGGVQ